MAAIVLFYTPSAKTTKAIFEDYDGEMSHEEKKQWLRKLKENKYSFMFFSLRHPFKILIKSSVLGICN